MIKLNELIVYGLIILFIMLVILLPALLLSFLQKGDDLQMEDHKNDISVRVVRGDQTVEDILLKDYLIGVIASEMPMTYELEALKAQAVAARTYVIDKILHGEQVSDDVMSQVYSDEKLLREKWGSDYDKYIEKLEHVISETNYDLLYYKGDIISPTYFAMSNGYTEDAGDYWVSSQPYLQTVASHWDEGAAEFEVLEQFSINEVEEKLHVEIDTQTELSYERTKSGRVSAVLIGSERRSGKEVREKLGLRSTDFQIEVKDDHVHIRTQGYGHGVGMSQYGANEMAKEGHTYKEILQYYYQGIDIEPISKDIIESLK